ncbi:hypothetical protein CSOJ01_11656 [Colletotrichum sojae]|uniref:Nephrocystin 3-like N-terminal domain-containing protein n=1 Tax=Colletotrichum sojae TaxID=2175907 RepID=A0A8H6MND4_9PEZI|nr:hypothetical protein CSOJ01_11656 [Colletotrichum sojae]
MPSPPSDSEDSDAVVLDRDDVSNYNPENILPQSSEAIAKLRAWLQPTSYGSESGEYRKHLSSHAAGTGNWLTASAAYKKWLGDENDGFLWIKGIPGSGKSVMASKIIRELSLANPGTPILYFFFRQIIDANHEPAALLRDWLDQILLYSPPLQKQIKEYVKNDRSLSSISMDDLWKHLRMAFSGLRGNVFCVADALDEMDRGNEQFLGALTDLGSWKPHKVKLLVTSRPVAAVVIPLRSATFSHVRLEENLVDTDISTYVQAGLQTSEIAPEDQHLIKEAIPGRANGLFLYAKLAMDAFLEPNANIQLVLNSLPTDLNFMYTDLLREHSRRSGVPDDVQLVILQSVTHATRPLRLLEIAEMIKVTDPGGSKRDLGTAKDLIRAACGPLLEILQDETVCVIHHSFTEYLKGATRSAGDTEYPILEYGATHAGLGLACLRYIRAVHSSFPGGKTLTGVEIVELRLKFPFMEYAASNWHVHLAKSTAAGHGQTEVNRELDLYVNSDDHLWAQICSLSGMNGNSRKTALHVCATCGLSEWAKHLIATGGVNVDAVDSNGLTPLFLASQFGKVDVARVLIANGANPDQDEKRAGLKPLHKAAGNNHADIVKLLLTAGVDPLTEKTRENPGRRCGNAARSVGHTPLMYACHNGHLESFEAFLPYLKDSETLHRALAWAAGRGRFKIVSRILARPGVDVNLKVRGGTPLFRAATNGSIQTVLTLLKRGADPSILCHPDEEFGGIGARCGLKTSLNDGLTALFVACSSSDMDKGMRGDPVVLREVLDLFIENGADVHQKTHDGRTLLHSAFNDPVWMRLLLDRGVDPNLGRDDGRTPLHEVMRFDCMALLVENGKADVNSVARSTGKTPLLYLLNGHYPTSAIKLLEYGPDCNIVDKDGNGALHIALSSYGSTSDIVDALLRAGSDPNLTNKAGQTPLDIMDLNNERMAEMMGRLIKAGAGINARDRDGATILFRTVKVRVAGRNDPHKDIKALLNQGASKDVRDFKGRTLLHEAVRNHEGIPETRRKFTDGLPSRLDFLLDLGLDPQATDHQGNTLLQELSLHSNTRFAVNEFLLVWDQLLELGLSLDQANHRGRTPLHNLACVAHRGKWMAASTTMIGYIIPKVGNVNAADQDGITPLHLAVTTSEYITKRLLEAGANPRLPTRQDLTPLHLAAKAKQSNVVGVLLDALFTLSGTRKDPGPPGAWLTDEHNEPVHGVNVQDSLGRTPLWYACESGRPEVVHMLLKAGADVHIGDLREAIDSFELEQDLWNTPRSRDPENRDAGGLVHEDDSRPSDGSGYQGTLLLHPFRDTTRLAEIIEMLLDHGADLSDRSPFGPLRYDTQDVSMTKTDLGCRDYTLKCLTRARERRGLRGPGNSKPTEHEYRSVSFDEPFVKYRQDAITRALGEFQHLTPGDPNQFLFVSRMMRRDYEAIEVLFHLGTNFLVGHSYHGSDSNLGMLIKGGFASLVDKIGWLEAERQHEKGICHAACDETRPGLSYNPKRDEKQAGNGWRTSKQPFLAMAVEQELPVFEAVSLLVDKFGVDVDELHFKGTPEESALHYVARGYYWWNVGQALPFLISRGANLDLRNGKGQTPLHLALDSGRNGCAGPYHLDAARLLILAGADVNAADGSGKTCLAYAAIDASMVRFLIEKGAEVKADAVFAAIDECQADGLEALLSAGVSPNLRYEKNSADDNSRCFTHRWSRTDVANGEMYPLHHSVTMLKRPENAVMSREHKLAVCKMIKILLTHGADPLAKFTRCTTRECSHQASDEVLLNNQLSGFPSGSFDEEAKDESKKPDLTAESEKHEECVVLHQLIKDGHIVDPILTARDLDWDFPDARGRTPLLAACYSRQGPDQPFGSLVETAWQSDMPTGRSLFEHLIQLGADPKVRDLDGSNALHHMLRERKFLETGRPAPILKSLEYMVVNHPGTINQRDKDGKTPLQLAVNRAAEDKKTTTEAEMLLKAGADPLVADNEGTTVLHILARRFRYKALQSLFQELIARGCDVNARDHLGESPLFKYFQDFPVLQSSRQEVLWFHDEDRKLWDEDAALAIFEEAGADFALRNYEGMGLLHVAAKGGCERFKGLMARGLDPMAEDNHRKTALDVAAAGVVQTVRSVGLDMLVRGVSGIANAWDIGEQH